MSARSLFTFLNIVGVLVLAALCGLQWKNESRLNAEVNALLQTQYGLEKTIDDQRKNIDGLSKDLALFKSQFAATKAELDETLLLLRKAENDILHLTAERDQLKEAVAAWQDAVKERDAHIEEANARIKEFAEALNESITKYNDLAVKFNEVVDMLNEDRQKLNQAYQDLDEARRQLYKALGKRVPPPAQPPEPAKENPEPAQ